MRVTDEHRRIAKEAVYLPHELTDKDGRVIPDALQKSWEDIYKERIAEALAKRDQVKDEEIERLKHWKKEVIDCMPDFQKIGILLELPLGTAVNEELIPGIEKLKAQLKTIKAENERLSKPCTHAEEDVLMSDCPWCEIACYEMRVKKIKNETIERCAEEVGNAYCKHWQRNDAIIDVIVKAIRALGANND